MTHVTLRVRGSRSRAQDCVMMHASIMDVHMQASTRYDLCDAMSKPNLQGVKFVGVRVPHDEAQPRHT